MTFEAGARGGHGGAPGTGRPLRFALPSSLGADRVPRLAKLLTDFFQVHLPNLAFEVTVADNYSELGRDLLAGRVHVGWSPPLVSARLEVAGGRPVARAVRAGSSSYRAALVCRHDKPVDPDRLRDLTAAWVDRESTAGYLLPRAWARSRGVDPDQAFARERFLGSYRAAVEEVVSGRADLTSVFASAPRARRPFVGLDELPGELREKVDIFAFTDETPNDAVCASPVVDEETFLALQKAFLDAPNDPLGRAVLEEVFHAEALEPAPANAYRVLYGVVLSALGLLSSPQTCASCGWRLSLQARFCERCGAPTGRAGPRRTLSGEVRVPTPAAPVWSEERKLATVLFADLAGFTSISSQLEPDAVREFANECFEPLSQEIEQRGGTIIKYIGDCVMAAFGVPIGSEDDPRRAVEASTAMMARISELSGRVSQKYGSQISLRIGLNTGLVMVGSVGGGSNSALDIMGTAVNLASRIQNQAHPGQVLIGPATQRLVQKYFELLPLGATELKGIPEPVPLFRVVAEKSDDEKAMPSAELALEPGFNLREKELQASKNAFETVLRTSRLRVVRVVADAGLGKSRLSFQTRSFLQAHPSRPVLLSASGVAAATGSVTPLGTLGRLIRTHFHVRADEDPVEARARVISGIAAAWGPTGGDEATESASLLANLCALHTPSVAIPLGVDESSFSQDRVFRAFVDWVQRLAGERPVGMFLHDLHWADEASLDFLERFVRAAKASAVFLLCTERPDLADRRPGFLLNNDAVERVELSPLPTHRMRQFIDRILPEVPGFPDSLKHELVQRSEGNPECARELVRLLIDRGAIVVGTDERPWEFRPERLGEIALPETIHGILQARLDSLPPAEKEALKHASVVGRTFWAGAVQALSDAEHEELKEVLDSLEQRGLIRVPRRVSLPGQVEYQFRTQALREITYRTMPRQTREAAHRKVAGWLEDRGQLWEGGHAELAGHLEAGGVPERARGHYLAAARHAAGVFANREAMGFYEKALAVWPQVQERAGRAGVRRELAKVLAHVGRFDDALAVLDDAAGDVQLGEAGDRAQAMAWIELERAQVHKECGRFDEVLKALDRGLALLEGEPPSLIKAWLYGERGFLKAVRNDSAGSRADCEAGVRLGELISDRGPGWHLAMAMLANTLACLHMYAGDVDGAEPHFGRGLEHANKAGSPRGRWVALLNLGAIAFDRKDFRLAASHFEQALVLARKGDRLKDIATCVNNLGQAELGGGDVDRALEHLEDARKVAQEAGLLDVLADSARAIAEARLARGAPAKALAEALQAVEHARRASIPWFEAMAHAVAMDCVLAGGLGDAQEATVVEAAQRHLDEAVRILRASNRASREAEVKDLEDRFTFGLAQARAALSRTA